MDTLLQLVAWAVLSLTSPAPVCGQPVAVNEMAADGTGAYVGWMTEGCEASVGYYLAADGTWSQLTVDTP